MNVPTNSASTSVCIGATSSPIAPPCSVSARSSTMALALARSGTPGEMRMLGCGSTVRKESQRAERAWRGKRRLVHLRALAAHRDSVQMTATAVAVAARGDRPAARLARLCDFFVLAAGEGVLSEVVADVAPLPPLHSRPPCDLRCKQPCCGWLCSAPRRRAGVDRALAPPRAAAPRAVLPHCSSAGRVPRLHAGRRRAVFWRTMRDRASRCASRSRR